MDTLKEINLRHADVLKQQMEEERKKKVKKMTTEELLLNKQKLKNIAENDDTKKFQKIQIVKPRVAING